MENSTKSMELKARELLRDVRLDCESAAVTELIDDTLSAIRESIDKIPQDLKVGGDEAPGFIRDIGSDKVDFTFKKPKSIEVAGSYAMQSLAKPYASVDVFLRLPKECFHEKDYLNHRYHGKRCIYLCVIKKYLGSSSLIKKIEWSTFQNEARKPVLLVYPVQELEEIPEFSMRIIPVATSLFDASKLKLSRSNLRAFSQGDDAQATPNYNHSILEDMFMEGNDYFVRKTLHGRKEFGDALILMKVWARLRTSVYSHDCFNGFLISVIMAYLASEKGGNRINSLMNALQIFRVTLEFIAAPKLWDKGLSLQPQGLLLQPHGHCRMTKEDWRRCLQLFPLVLIDSSGHFNLAFRVSKSGILEFHEEAAATLNCLGRCEDGGFEGVFTTKVDFAAKYDYCMRVNLNGNSEIYASGLCSDKEFWRTYEEKVHTLIEQGLNDRAKLIRVIWRNNTELNVEEGLSKFSADPLLVGVLCSSSEKSVRMVDIGPNSENKEEATDDTLYVPRLPNLEGFGVKNQSFVGLEMELLQKAQENLVVVADQLDFCLPSGVRDSISSSGNLLEAFEALSKCLRKLDDIPLRVISVQPLDSAFRLTSVFPPQPHPLATAKGTGLKSKKLVSTCIQPLEVLIQLERSGKWPKEDMPIRQTRSVYLLKIGERRVNLNLKNWGIACTATEDEVDVLMSGYAFRLRLSYGRGLKISQRQYQLRQALTVDQEVFIHGLHSGMINGLQGIYPTFGPVVRLAKRWIASHLFSSFLAEEAIELLVAYLFLKPSPFPVPCSRITGYLRFLRLLSNYDWNFSPLIVDINNVLTVEDEKKINEDFMLTRKVYKEKMQNVEPAMFLATAYDKASMAWTRVSPNSSLPPDRRSLSHTTPSLLSLATPLVALTGIASARVAPVMRKSEKWEFDDWEFVEEGLVLGLAEEDEYCSVPLCRSPNSQWQAKAKEGGHHQQREEVGRMMAYARSSADYLTKLIMQGQTDSHIWESLFRTPLNNYDAVLLLHGDRLPFPEHQLFSNDIAQGKLVARGKASKIFNPYIRLQGSLDDVKDKLLVNFDPLRCYIEDLKKEFPHTFTLWFDTFGGDAIGLTWEQRESKKRPREEPGKDKVDPMEVLRDVARCGKGLVRSVHLIKAPRC
ncbi:hypothetical protein Sjap_010357 [Stephania japonica]|uniref:Nucleolar protein 6 n=1 Tax=Stephania japonica TaxID=461633 RepID=A0AAP0JB19_9MAGN